MAGFVTIDGAFVNSASPREGTVLDIISGDWIRNKSVVRLKRPRKRDNSKDLYRGN